MTAPLSVSDFLSNASEQMVNGANLMSRSKPRQKIFEAIYKGQKQEKSVNEIMAKTGLTYIRVLNEAKKLGQLVEKVRNGFRKRKELASHYKKILSYARNKKKRESVPTKFSPRINAKSAQIRVTFAPAAAKAIPVTIEDIDSFSKAKRVAKKLGPTKEEIIKKAFAKIAG